MSAFDKKGQQMLGSGNEVAIPRITRVQSPGVMGMRGNGNEEEPKLTDKRCNRQLGLCIGLQAV